MVLVKRGGKVAYTCAGCGNQINAKEPHERIGNSGHYQRFHKGCMPKADEKSGS